jgi:hypothetical protein
VPQRDFARQMLSMVKRDARFPPFVAAVDDAVEGLLESAVAVGRTMGVLPPAAHHDSSPFRGRDQGGPIPAAAQAAANYYRPVLTQLFEAAVRLHLQVQGTNSTAYVFVPGEQAAGWATCQCLRTQGALCTCPVLWPGAAPLGLQHARRTQQTHTTQPLTPESVYTPPSLQVHPQQSAWPSLRGVCSARTGQEGWQLRCTTCVNSLVSWVCGELQVSKHFCFSFCLSCWLSQHH